MEIFIQTQFLPWLLRATWQASVLIGVVLLVQWLFRKQLPPRWRYSLWLLVVIRLVLPFSMESALSLFNLWPKTSTAASALQLPNSTATWPFDQARQTLRVETPADSLLTYPELPPRVIEKSSPPITLSDLNRTPGGTNFFQLHPTKQTSPSPTLQRLDLIFLVWLAGVAALLTHVAFTSQRLCRKIGLIRPLTDSVVLNLLDHCKQTMGIRTPLTLIETAAVSSPALYGFLRPRLLLPEGMMKNFSTQELRFVFLHELAHVKRRDIALNWLITALQIVHWFNPLVWYAFSRMRADRELACDALALSYTREGESKPYGETIIKLLEGFTRPVPLPGLVGILEDKNQMKRRITMIARFKRTSRWPASAVLLFVLLSFAGLTDAQPKKTPAGATKETAKAAEVQPQPRGSIAPSAQSKATQSELLFLVVDAVNGEKLADAKLKVTGCNSTECFLLGRFTTGPSGPVSIRYPAKNTSSLAVSVSKEGYVPKLVSWRPRHNDLIDGQYIAKLDPGMAIGGVVKDEAGQLVVGVNVFLDGPHIDDPIAREHSGLQGGALTALSDARGKWVTQSAPKNMSQISFRLEHPAFAESSFEHDGFAKNNPDRSALISLKDLQSQTAVFILKRGEVARGRVTDKTGIPVPDASVLLGQKFALHPRRQKTDADGRFSFTNCSAFQRIVTVQANGYAPELRFLDTDTPSTEVNIQLAPGGIIKGRVADEQGKPIEDVRVGVGTAVWRGAQLLDWDTRTDTDGRFTWDSAPTESIVIGFYKPGYAIVYMRFTADTSEQPVTLPPQKRLTYSGRVVDAETKEPVQDFRVTPGESYTTDENRPHYSWQRLNPVRGRDGQYALNSDEGVQLLKIEAQGYLPAVSKQLTEEDAGQPIDFELQKGGNPSGVVTLPNGKPAAGATLVLCTTSSRAYMDGPGRFRLGLYDAASAETDATGRFSLSLQLGAAAIVVAHEDGFAEIPLNEFTNSGQINLKPWGRVEGTLSVGSQPGAEEEVWITNMHWRYGEFPHVQLFLKTQTDAFGHFSLEGVPPGEHKIERCLKFRQGRPGPIPLSHGMPILVKAGETMQVKLGGTGQPVIGRVVASGSDTVVDWIDGVYKLALKTPGNPDFSRPKREGYSSQEAFSQAWKTFAETDRAYWQGEQGKKHERARREYVLVFKSDGSFRVDDVPSGSYELSIIPGGPGHPDNIPILMKGEKKWLEKEVVVPDMHSGRSDEPVDLGTLELQNPKQSQVARP